MKHTVIKLHVTLRIQITDIHSHIYICIYFTRSACSFCYLGGFITTTTTLEKKTGLSRDSGWCISTNLGGKKMRHIV